MRRLRQRYGPHSKLSCPTKTTRKSPFAVQQTKIQLNHTPHRGTMRDGWSPRPLDFRSVKTERKNLHRLLSPQPDLKDDTICFGYGVI